MNTILSLLFIIISLLLTKLFSHLAFDTRLMDKPNERSLHNVPKVRGGGVVFVSLFLLFLLVATSCYALHAIQPWILLLATFLLAVIGFIDDLFNLSAKPRFVVQCIVASLIIIFVCPTHVDLLFFSLNNYYLITLFLFFSAIWAMNHFNFMDGLDGFCGSQALFLFIAYAMLFHFSGAWFYQSLCIVMAACLVGFLAFNFPPAKLFMGDVGSVTLGFISFTMAVIAQYNYHIPLSYWFILNGLFLFDSTMTLLRRVAHGERWFAAHRKHAYQRLKQFGINTRVILLGQTFINVSFLALILLFHYHQISQYFALIIAFCTLVFFYYLVEWLFPMYLREGIEI